MLLLSSDDPSVTGWNFQLMSLFSARVLLSTLFAGASWQSQCSSFSFCGETSLCVCLQQVSFTSAGPVWIWTFS